jgi:MFS family permease
MFFVKGIQLWQIGIIGTVCAALSAVLQISAGWLSDKFGRKPVLVVSFAITGITLPFYALASTAKDFLILLAIQSVSSTLIEPTSNSFICDMAPKDTVARFFATYGSITTIFSVISMFMTLALNLVNWSVLFLTSGIMVIIATFLMLTIKEERKCREEETMEQEKPQELKASQKVKEWTRKLRSVASDRIMLGITLNFVFFNLALGVYPTYIPILAGSLGLTEAWMGPVVAISWITYAIAQPFGGSISDRSKRRKPLILLGLILTTLFNLGLGFSPALLWMCLFWGLLGIGDGLSRPVRLALVADRVKEKRGLMFGVIWGLGTFLGIVLPSVYAYLAQRGKSLGLGYSMPFLLATVFLLLSTLSILQIKEKKID